MSVDKYFDRYFNNNILGLYLTFATPTIIEDSVSLLSSTFNQSDISIPLLISANVLSSSKSSSADLIEAGKFLQLIDQVPSAIPVLGWSTFYGMDQIFDRIRTESILQEFQTKRIIKVIEQLYQDGKEIPQEDARFVELLQRKLKRTSLSSFTELAVGQLYKAIELNGFHVLETEKIVPKYYNPRKRARVEQVREILTDLYISSTSYREEDVARMIQITENKRNVGISLRAGLVRGQARLSILER